MSHVYNSPYLACERTTGLCVEKQPHNAREHLDPRHPLYDGPDFVIGALNSGPRRAARALIATGAPVPEVVDLVEEIHRLKDQTAHLMVDKDRAVRAASDRALDCGEHGEQIRELEKQLAAIDESYRKADAGRVALVGFLHGIRESVDKLRERQQRGDALPSAAEMVDALDALVKKADAAHDRAWKR